MKPLPKVLLAYIVYDEAVRVRLQNAETRLGELDKEIASNTFKDQHEQYQARIIEERKNIEMLRSFLHSLRRDISEAVNE